MEARPRLQLEVAPALAAARRQIRQLVVVRKEVLRSLHMEPTPNQHQ
jgi:hypothetical protein